VDTKSRYFGRNLAVSSIVEMQQHGIRSLHLHVEAVSRHLGCSDSRPHTTCLITLDGPQGESKFCRGLYNHVISSVCECSMFADAIRLYLQRDAISKKAQAAEAVRIQRYRLPIPGSTMLSMQATIARPSGITGIALCSMPCFSSDLMTV
jgi:hypothetical protein